MKRKLMITLSALALGAGAVAQIPQDGLFGFYGLNGDGVNQTGKGYDAFIYDQMINRVVKGEYVTDRFGNPNGALKLNHLQYLRIISDSLISDDFILSFWVKLSGFSRILLTDNFSVGHGETDGIGTNNGLKSKKLINDGEWHNVVIYRTINRTYLLVDDTSLYVAGVMNTLGNSITFVRESVESFEPLYIDDVIIYNTGSNNGGNIVRSLPFNKNYIPSNINSTLSDSGLVISGKNLTGSTYYIDGNLVDTILTSDTLVILQVSQSGGTLEIRKNFDKVYHNFGSVGVADIAARAGFSVYPNPSHGTVNIDSNLQNYEVRVYTTDGRLLQQPPNAKQISLPQSGLYLIQINAGEESFFKRVLID